jgi:putative membrane protein
MIAVSAATLLVAAGCNREDMAAERGPDLAVNAPANEAIDTTENREPGAPIEGANSFTEGQAAARLAEMGYTNVTGLTMGEDGIWRGQAQKDGANVQVAVDFQGNVTP